MKNVLVLGLGVSGLSAAKLLLSMGCAVTERDDRIKSSEVNWNGIDCVVVSPGIPPTHPFYTAAREKGLEIIGEAEFCLRYIKQPAVAITGTNGKTTVTLLVEHILNSSGVKAKALGNVGYALSAYLLNPDPQETLVVELSSYQLETMQTPAFDAAVLLNITPDHLDRHASMEEYASAKCRLQHCLKPTAPFYVQLQVAREYSFLLKRSYQTFGTHSDADFQTNKELARNLENVEYFLPLRYRDVGLHEAENSLAAWLLCKRFKISAEQFCQGLETFQKPPHRIEFVTTIDGVRFYDDSKGTNLDAVIQAVKAMDGQVILIVGGMDKGAPYLPWKDHFQGKVKCIIAIGQAAHKIYQELNPYFNMELADSLSSAVEASVRYAVEGDNVLLSPGCSSLDMFSDYAHRGKEFQRNVYHLRERRKLT